MRPSGLFLIGVATCLASAQEQQPLVFVNDEPVPLVDLLEACAAFHGLPLEVDRSKISGSVTMRSGPGFSQEGIWALANRELGANGLACIQPSGEEALAVVPLAQAAKLARLEGGDVAIAKAGFVKVMEPVTSIEPSKAAEVVAKVFTGEGSVVQAVGEKVLLAGPKPQVQEALQLLWALDGVTPETAVELVPVKNLPPSAVVALIERIKAALSTVGTAPAGTLLANPASSSLIVVAPHSDVPRWRALIEQFDVVEAAVTRNYIPRRFGLHETAELIEAVVRGEGEAPGSWRLVEDELTDTLIVTAPYSTHEEIEALFRRIESSETDPRRSMRAFPVKHRKVDEMLALLESLLEGAPLPTTEAAPPPAETPPAPTEAAIEKEAEPAATGGKEPSATDLTLSMDAGTNRLLAIGPPRSLDELGLLIAELDVQEPQVLIETLIVALTESETLSVAVELQKIGTENGTLYRLASLFNAGSPDPEVTPEIGGLPAASGTGLETVVLDPGSFSGVLRALEVVNHGRTLTVPKVLVNNHETAHLDSVLQQPFATSNTSTNLATISFGGTLDAGTTVSVTPQITEGDMLLLDYEVTLSAFVGDSPDPTLPPPRQENSLGSVATIPDGYAVVVGGIDIDRETKAESRVPILGAIPILGNLFKSQSKTDSKSKFYVFLRASVLRNAGFEDLRYVTAPALAVAGVGDGLPVVEPRVIR